ncbi:hypothetical protein HHI36_003367 [Cryptolaemus montrouzieri]|uniref:Uncharacterized protein n=1 Tax=Cryptolaemus montrouzieri TaxID=559131 RepID=A0ABD2PD85_9CUCU
MIRNIKQKLVLNKNFFNIIRYTSNTKRKPIYHYQEPMILNEEEQKAYMKYFPRLWEDATHIEGFQDYPLVRKRLGRMIEHISPCGKHMKQHLLIYTYKSIEEHYKSFTPDRMEQIHQLAWCSELLNSQFLMLDDIMDDHHVRHGKITWFKMEGVDAINDTYLIQTALYQLIKKYFCKHPNYIKILENFMWQELAITMALESETKNFEDFTLERCYARGVSKFAYYSFGQVLSLATLLANKGLHMYEMGKKVCDYLGFLFTLRNDLLDHYAGELNGKPGLDIQGKEFTNLIAFALHKASPSQKRILEECYGHYDNEKVEKVKKLYEELGVLEECFALEKTYCDKILEELENMPDEFLRSLFEKYLYATTYGRFGVPIIQQNEEKYGHGDVRCIIQT